MRPFALGAGSDVNDFPITRKIYWGNSNGSKPKVTYNFLSGAMPSGLTFTRASTGCYYNSSGVLAVASANGPRFDYNPSTLVLNGLLFEAQATNLFTYSNDFTQSSWTKQNSPTIILNAGTSPDGSNNAQLLTAGTNTSIGAIIFQQITNSAAAYDTGSVFMKQGNCRYGFLLLFGGSSGLNRSAALFDLQTGTVVRTYTSEPGYTPLTNFTASIQPCPNGWNRISVSATFPSGQVALLAIQWTNDVNAQPNNGNYTIPNTAGDTAYAYGAQGEERNGPSSYIATTSATVTRAEDFLTEPLTNLTGYDNNNSTLQVEALRNFYPGSFSIDISVDDGTVFNRNFLAGWNVSQDYKALSVSANTVGTIDLGNVITYGSVYKSVMSWNATTFSACFNGGVVQSVTNNPPVSPTTLRFSDQASTGATSLSGWLRKFSYWNKALTNTQLQQVTT